MSCICNIRIVQKNTLYQDTEGHYQCLIRVSFLQLDLMIALKNIF